MMHRLNTNLWIYESCDWGVQDSICILERNTLALVVGHGHGCDMDEEWTRVVANGYIGWLRYDAPEDYEVIA